MYIYMYIDIHIDILYVCICNTVAAAWCTSGIFFILPCTDSIIKVDLRTVSFDIPPQEVSSIL